MLAVLESLDLQGCIVTADALHWHLEMAQSVRAHYALKLKGNNAPLHACAVKAFAEADARGDLSFHETSNTQHDRFERRKGCVLTPPKDALRFPDLVLFGRIDSERRLANGKTTTFTHYVALSKCMSPQQMVNIFCAHWGVENNLNRPLDVAFESGAWRSLF